MIRKSLLLTVAIGLLGQSASAAVALSDLIANNDSIVSGDLVFDQFSFSGFGGIDDSIEILVVDTPQGEPGIRFQGGFSDLPGDGASGFSISYVVSVVGGGTIDSSVLSGNIAAIMSGFGTATSTFGGQSLEITDNADTGVTDLLDSTAVNPPASQLAVQLDFSAEAGAVGGVTGSFIDQNFDASGVIPEMSSLGTWVTLLMGAVGFCLFNQYRKPSTSKVKA